MSQVQFSDIQAAAARLQGQAHRTPVITSRILNERVNADVFLKGEHLQRMGAFKFRGAYNAMSQLNDDQKACGVVTFSSGNHAQAIALVGKLLGVKTTIVMPNNAPKTKRIAVAGYGGQIVLYDPETESREAIGRDLAEKTGAVLIPPYDHAHVIAGQGTAALELIEEVGDLDMLFVCTGGGGLLSGCAIAAKNMLPKCQVIGIEPELADDATKSFHTKTLHTVKNPPTIADGTRTPSLGTLTFPLVLDYVDDMRTVSEDQIKEAVRFAFTYLKQVMEPSGVLGLAGAMNTPVQGRVGVIISGGNIDADVMTMILSE
jgi:threonine dehydratase